MKFGEVFQLNLLIFRRKYLAYYERIYVLIVINEIFRLHRRKIPIFLAGKSPSSGISDIYILAGNLNINLNTTQKAAEKRKTSAKWQK